MKTVIVDLRDGGDERYDVGSYWYEDGGLVLELCDEDDRRMGTVRYAPGAVVSVTEWAEDEDEDDGDEDESMPQTFKVGTTRVSVEQCWGEGIQIRDIDHDWLLLQLQPSGLHLYQAIGDDAGFELESHDDVGGYLKTRWN